VPASRSTPLADLQLAHLPVPAVVLDLDDLTVLDVNDEALGVFGFARDEVAGALFTRLVQQPAPLLEACAAAVPEAVLLEGRRSNGVPFTLEVRARVLGAADGRLALCLLREAFDDALRSAAEHFFDAAFAQSPIGMALYNTDGEFVRVNPAFCAMLGRTQLSLLGTRDQLLTHPDDRRRDVDAAWRILRGELDTFEAEKRFLHRDGTVVWVNAKLAFLRDEQGRPIAWLGQFQDITERRRHEERLGILARPPG
jgi:PAS domain S-box-containing protein